MIQYMSKDGVKMLKEFSCGAVLFCKEDGIRKYVLVMEPNGLYGFPKGHVEGKESDIETARREIYEETGVNPIFIPNLKRTIRYKISPNDEKEVTYFVAKFENEKLHIVDKNILGIKLLELDAALSLLKFPELRNILVETDYILNEKGE